jgi:hypothetical protein
MGALTTAQIAMMAFSGVGTVFSAVSSVSQQAAANQRATNSAIAANNAAIFKGQVARRNAVIAQQNADAIRDRGEQAIQDKRRQIINISGAARARQAALGFIVGEGSNLDLIGDLAEAGELDILRLRDAADLEARNAEEQANLDEFQARLFDLEAGSALAGLVLGNPLLAGAGTLLEGAGTVFAQGVDFGGDNPDSIFGPSAPPRRLPEFSGRNFGG